MEQQDLLFPACIIALIGGIGLPSLPLILLAAWAWSSSATLYAASIAKKVIPNARNQ